MSFPMENGFLARTEKSSPSFDVSVFFFGSRN